MPAKRAGFPIVRNRPNDDAGQEMRGERGRLSVIKLRQMTGRDMPQIHPDQCPDGQRPSGINLESVHSSQVRGGDGRDSGRLATTRDESQIAD
jgi:hypothetical protein